MTRILPFKHHAICPKREFSPESVAEYDTHASLIVYTGDETPDEVSMLLNIIPSFVEYSGNSQGTSESKETEKLNCWCLNSANNVASNDLREHLRWLLTTIESADVNFLETLHRGWRSRIFCFWSTSRMNSDIFLDNDLLQKISDMKLHLDFDIWTVPSEKIES